MNTTLVLTGATGFLGSQLLPALLQKRYNVIVLTRPQSRIQNIQYCLKEVRLFELGKLPLETVFQENKVDIVVHCATNYGRSHAVQPIDVFDANLVLPLKLLQLANQYHTRAFLNTDTILDKRISFYTLSKRQFLEWMEMFSTNLVTVNVALEHFYGPGDDPTKFVSHMLSDLLEEASAIDLTPGQQIRDFIYIDDVVSAFLKILEFAVEAENGLHRFEVGGDTRMTIRQFTELAKELTGNEKTELRFGAIPYRPNEVMDTNVHMEPLLKLGWRPHTSLREGLLKTIEGERRLK